MNVIKRKGTRNQRWTRYISLMLSAVLVIGIMSIRFDFVRADTSASKEQTSLVADEHSIQGVYYRTQVQEIGWQEYVGNGETSGTSGQSKRLEAIQIKLENIPGGIEYRTHVQDAGWQDWSADDAVSGTVGMSKRLEAIEIRLT
ncbi:MAG: hypothetical protein PHP22_10395, partial [Oscillospiraceae bacterium]|nr:hypothetical protein [Oscillospiraceae bacterium]